MKIHRWKSNCYQEGRCAESNPQNSTQPVNQGQIQLGKGSIPSDDGGISTSKQETETGKSINNVDEIRETGLDNSGTVGNTPNVKRRENNWRSIVYIEQSKPDSQQEAIDQLTQH